MGAIVVRQPNVSDWGMIQAIANSSFESRKFGLVKVQEAEIKLLMAYENGLPLTSAFQSVYVINGVPALSPKAIWAKIINHPDFAGFKEERLEEGNKFFGYKITLSRKNGMQVTRQFTMADAKIAGLDKKDNWVAYAPNMCFWRALGFVEDIVFPDVTLGMNRADELGALVTVDGTVIEGSWNTVAQPAPTPGANLQTLIDTYGVAAIMAANNDTIPATPEEIEAVAVRLAEQADTLAGVTLDSVQPLEF